MQKFGFFLHSSLACRALIALSGFIYSLCIPALSLATESVEDKTLAQSISASTNEIDFILHMASYLTAEQILHLADKNKKLKDFLTGLENNAELSLSGKILGNDDFLTLFGKEGVFSKAKKINLTGCQFDHKLLAKLPKSVVSLRLAKTGFRPESLQHLSKLTRLAHLDLAANPIGTHEPETILPAQALSLAENDSSLDLAESIAQFSHLETLNLSSSRLNEAEKKEIKSRLPHTKIIF